jgi:hypothetical protein
MVPVACDLRSLVADGSGLIGDFQHGFSDPLERQFLPIGGRKILIGGRFERRHRHQVLACRKHAARDATDQGASSIVRLSLKFSAGR